MAKYLLLKHYRGAPASVNNVAMDQWTPQEVEDHVQYMNVSLDGWRAPASMSIPKHSHRRVSGSVPTAKVGHRSPTAPFRRARI